jgi:hypothetical protein
MLKVVIVGERHSGKATLLGLLYMTQVRFGSDITDEFRFHVPSESLEAISFVFQQLMSGAFPDPVTKQGIHQIHFQLSYRNPGGILSRFRGRRWASQDSPSLRFIIQGGQDDEFSRVVQGTPIEEERWKDVYDSDVVIILVDGTKLGVPDEKKPAGPMSAYDGAVDSLLGLVQRPSEPEIRKKIHPILVFSKFDRVKPDVLSSANIGTEPPSSQEARARASYAEALLEHNLPRTLARIRTRASDAIPFAKPTSFFTWVRTNTAPGHPEKMEFGRSEDGSWELKYSRHEYLSLLECLKEIVATQR